MNWTSLWIAAPSNCLDSYCYTTRRSLMIDDLCCVRHRYLSYICKNNFWNGFPFLFTFHDDLQCIVHVRNQNSTHAQIMWCRVHNCLKDLKKWQNWSFPALTTKDWQRCFFSGPSISQIRKGSKTFWLPKELLLRSGEAVFVPMQAILIIVAFWNYGLIILISNCEISSFMYQSRNISQMYIFDRLHWALNQDFTSHW